MAHEVETMAWTDKVPWHRLGVEVSNDLTPEEMLKAAGLDWEVVKAPCFAEFGTEFLPTGKSALVRDSDAKVLSVVSDDWNPVQNKTAFEFFSDFVSEGDMEMHTAGSLRGGNMVWALAKVSESFTVFGGDTVESYLLFSNPHEYGKSVDVRFTPVRVVCNNTLTFSLRGKNDLMIRVDHRNVFDEALVKDTLGIATMKLNTYKEAAEFLGSKRYTKENLESFLQDIFPASGKKKEKGLLSLPAGKTLLRVEDQPGADFAPGTWWNALNAVTYMIDHELGRNADNRLANAWYGAMRNRKVQALEKAVEFASAA